MKLSIVTSMYYSGSYLEEFYCRVKKAAQQITDDYEIIFVNDGSPDNSLEVVRALLEHDKKIKIIDLSQNFGHHKAIMTGLSYAKGDYVFLLDCDLEEEPELLGKFYHELTSSQDVDVVFGVQKQREGGFTKRVGGALFYLLFNFLSHYKIPRSVMLARLMTRRYVDSLLKFKDKEPLFAGLCSIAGFKQEPVEVNKHYKGHSTYTFLKRFSVLANAIISFSNYPLICMFYLGLIISGLSFLFILYLVAVKIFLKVILGGWVSIMVSIWFLGGLIMCSLGVIGLYLAKTFEEVKDRPITVIKNIYQGQGKEGEN